MGNLKTDPTTGVIWTVIHPIGRPIIDIIVNRIKVLRLRTDSKGLITDVTEIYDTVGREYVELTVALPYKEYMLAGSVESTPVVCKLDTLT